MKKKLLIIACILISISILSAAFDFSRVHGGQEPVFVWARYNGASKEYLGLFYYFSEEVSISPTQPLSHSASVKMGIWFIPGIQVYSSLNKKA